MTVTAHPTTQSQCESDKTEFCILHVIIGLSIRVLLLIYAIGIRPNIKNEKKLGCRETPTSRPTTEPVRGHQPEVSCFPSLFSTRPIRLSGHGALPREHREIEGPNSGPFHLRVAAVRGRLACA